MEGACPMDPYSKFYSKRYNLSQTCIVCSMVYNSIGYKIIFYEYSGEGTGRENFVSNES